MNAADTFAYVAKPNKNELYKCPISASGELSTCVAADSIDDNKNTSIRLNAAETHAYVSGRDRVELCALNKATGNIYNCSYLNSVPFEHSFDMKLFDN